VSKFITLIYSTFLCGSQLTKQGLGTTCGFLKTATSEVRWKKKDLPGHRHGKLFIGRPCKKIADDLLKLSRHQLKVVVATLTEQAPVRGHLYSMGLCWGYNLQILQEGD